MSVDLSGGCDAPPTQRLLALDISRNPIRAYALDGAFLLYATDSAIRRVRLPRRGSTPRPPNDDFDRATPADLAGTIVGRVGHASLQAGEPELQGSERTVWLRFQAPRTEELRLFAPGFRFTVFVGADLRSITAIGSSVDNPPLQDDVSISVVAGQTYSIQLGSVGPYPTYKPFRLSTLALDP